MKMKHLLPVLLLSSIVAKAQTVPSCNPFPKTISVSGSAEMEIVPDQIYVQVDLQEYKKKGENKVDIEKIKTDFLNKCKQVGLPDSVISIASYGGSNYNSWYWKKRKKDPDLYASISYQVIFKESKKMDELVDILDDDATANFQIVKLYHSKMPEFRKQLKIQAVKAAKDKGVYLTEAVNEKLGEAITIQEPEEDAASNNNNGRYYNMANAVSQMRMKEEKFGDNESGGVSFKKIKLRYEVNVVFALK
ncbi:MAG: SIMPL domain-containing protein [Bacteroidetes bacterium]|nr:SIMPL domain-containing protein [Bacteroidota bacterium]